jgi:Glycosyltransferase family 9 (heptosyltransferase)
MRTLPGAPRVVSVARDLPPLAAQTTMSSLPGLLGTTVDNIPADCPYLNPPADLVAHWATRLALVCPAGYRRIGLAWAGRPEHGNDRNRSLSLSDLSSIGGFDNVSIVSLQKGGGAAGLGSIFWRAPVFNAGPECDTFIDTAAAISCLDLVITVDTAVAHLAGALGKPCWIMLPYAPDWRWLQARTDTPWYPNTRLFRQTEYGNWKTVIAEVTQALADSLPARPAVMVGAD